MNVFVRDVARGTQRDTPYRSIASRAVSRPRSGSVSVSERRCIQRWIEAK